MFAQEEIIDTVTVGDEPVAVAYNPNNQNMYVVNQASDMVSVIEPNNEVVNNPSVSDGPVAIANNSNNGNIYVVNQDSDTVSVIGVKFLPFEGILGSGNNINIQVQENSGNNVGGQSGKRVSYSDSPVYPGQSTRQDSSVISW